MLAGKSPGIVFMTGFMSDMTGSSARARRALPDRGHADLIIRGMVLLRYFANGTIGLWAEELWRPLTL